MKGRRVDTDPRTIQAETFIRFVEYRPTTDSTNRLALELLRGEVELPALIIADEQTAGRGRGANAWWSAAGALTFTVAVRRDEAASTLPPYSLVAGLAVRDTLQSFLPQQEIHNIELL